MQRWLRSHWLLLAGFVTLFLVGVGVGSAGSDETDSQPARVVTQSATAATVVEAETVTVTETVDPTQEQLEALQDRAAALEDRAAAFRQRERAVTERERKVKRAERVIARSRFGDGVYLVGKDIPPGSYVSRGGGTCYWARLSRDGTDILDNHIGSGQARATINTGELFETADCGTWTWRRG